MNNVKSVFYKKHDNYLDIYIFYMDLINTYFAMDLINTSFAMDLINTHFIIKFYINNIPQF